MTHGLSDHERRVAEAIASRSAPPAADGVVDQVAAIFGISPTAIFGRSREALVVDARSVAVYLLRERGWHQVEIARYLLRDHSTIAHMEKRLEADRELRDLARGAVA